MVGRYCIRKLIGPVSHHPDAGASPPIQGKQMNIDNLTFGELKQTAAMFGAAQSAQNGTLQSMIGKKCIVRTYISGVFFGEIEQKAGNEVIVKNARRMWRWHAAESISLSAVALHGIKEKQSKIAEAVPSVWLEAIELIPCSDKAIASIEGAPNVNAD